MGTVLSLMSHSPSGVTKFPFLNKLGVHCFRGGVAGGAGGATAPPGFWMGSKKIQTTEFGKQKLCSASPLCLRTFDISMYLSKIPANHLDCFINSLFIME